MKVIRKAVTACLSGGFAVLFALILSYHPGYLREYSLLSSVRTLGLSSLRYGRRELLVLAAVLFLIFAFSARSLRLNKSVFSRAAFFSGLLTALIFLRDLIGVPALRAAGWSILFFVLMLAPFVSIICLFDFYLQNKERIRIRRERDALRAKEIVSAYKLPFLSTVAFGLIAYGWFFTNKILNFDELYNLFGKGAEIELGRWGLPVISLLLPDVSVPWLWGLLALLLLAAAVCLILSLIGIENRLLQCLVAGVIVSFPAETATVLYMFMVPSSALAFFLAVAAVKLLRTAKQKRFLCGSLAVLAEVFSVSIYQANVTVTSTLLVLLLILDFFSEEAEKSDFIGKLLKKSVSYFAFLILSMGVYYALTLAVQKVTGIGFSGYSDRALENGSSLLQRILLTFRTFGNVYSSQVNGIIRSEVAEVLHVLVVLIGYFAGFFVCIKKFSGCRGRIALFAVYTVILLPMSISGLNLFLNPDSLHAVTMMSYALVFVFTAKMTDLVSKEELLPGSANVLSLLIAAIITGNVWYSNVIGLRMYMEYENAYSAYTAILSDIQSLPDYKAEYKIALGGILPVGDYTDRFGLTEENSVFGVSSFRNDYSRNEFIQQYLGYDAQIANSHEVNMLRETPEYAEMPVYPNAGFVKVIDGYVMVKLSDGGENYYRGD